MISLDYFLFKAINDLAGRNACFDSLAIFFADYFQYLVVLSAIIIFWKNWRFYWQAILAIILSRFIFTEAIRFFYYRPRPFIDHQVHRLIDHELSGSFPSGHAAFFFALAMIVFLYPSTLLGTSNKKAGWYFFAAAFLISLARVFAGIHYPLDILVGAVVGIFSGWLIFKISRILRSRTQNLETKI